MRRILILLGTLLLASAATLLFTFSVSATAWGNAFNVANSAAKVSVALDPNDEMYFVWANTQRGVIEYRHCAAADACDAVESLPRRKGTANSPALALDSQNRPVVAWAQEQTTKRTIYFSRREAGGWTAPIALSSHPQSILPALAIGTDDRLQVAYESVQNNTRKIYYVSVNGQNPISPILIDTEPADAQTDTEPDRIANGRNVRIAVDGANQAHVVWNTLQSPYSVKYAYQQNNVFKPPKIVANDAQDQTPDIAIDRETNRVGIIWETRKNNHAAFILLENGAEVYRNRNVESGSKIVRQPRLAVDCGGRFQIAFQRRESANSVWDIFYRQFDPESFLFTGVQRLTQSNKNDARPALAAQRFALIAYITGSDGKLNARRGDIEGLCHGNTPPPSPWEHIPNSSRSVKYAGNWRLVSDTQASDKDFARCGTGAACKAGSSAKMDFVGGTRLEWETAYANTFGIVNVYIDGSIFERVDLCALNKNSSKPKFGKRTYILKGNETTPHSIQIKSVGKSSCTTSNKAYFVIDGFNVLR